MRDRRGAIRYRCQLRCTLRRGTARHDATVLDLSSSGLSVRTTLDLAQGDEVDLLIEPDIQFQAIAWRTTRTRSGFVVGMMLSARVLGIRSARGATRSADARRDARPRPPPPPPTEPPAQMTESPPPTSRVLRRRLTRNSGGGCASRTATGIARGSSRSWPRRARMRSPGRSPRSAEAGRFSKRKSPRAHRPRRR